MTMAAKFAIAQDCVLGIMRMICQIIYELDNQATWANILACQSLSGRTFGRARMFMVYDSDNARCQSQVP